MANSNRAPRPVLPSDYERLEQDVYLHLRDLVRDAQDGFPSTLIVEGTKDGEIIVKHVDERSFRSYTR
jgi:hypothetical protein